MQLIPGFPGCDQDWESQLFGSKFLDLSVPDKETSLGAFAVLGGPEHLGRRNLYTWLFFPVVMVVRTEGGTGGEQISGILLGHSEVNVDSLTFE